MPLLSRVQGDVGEEVSHEIHLVHGPHPAVEAGQTAGIGGEAEGQLVGAEGLAPGAAVLFVLARPYFPSPSRGWPAAANWARIWWVRPVTRRQATRDRPFFWARVW